MRITKYLNAVMDSRGFTQDKELAPWLGVTPSAISQYRRGVRTMDNEKCVLVALELGIDPIAVIMATDIDRADRAGQKSLWEVFLSRTATAASVLLGCGAVTLFLTLAPEPAQAAAFHSQFDNNTNYAKLKLILGAVRPRFEKKE